MLQIAQKLCKGSIFFAKMQTFLYLCRRFMNTLGKYFSFTSFGESHGRAIGGVLDGVPAGIKIDLHLIRQALDRRAGRTSSLEETTAGVSPRALRESDTIEWLSGVIDDTTIGTPIAFIIRNKDAHSDDYEWLKHSFRKGHADFTYQQKYGIRDHRGGGRASARETASRVVAGSIAKQLLQKQGIYIHAKLIQVGEETNPENFATYIANIQQAGDSIGGIVQCCITGLPIGIGDPIFDKLQSHLAFAMLSINACKGFDYGSGFEHVDKRGSEMYLSDNQQLISGGIAGGISDGTPLLFRCVFKPTPSNPRTLAHLAEESNTASAPIKARMDACVAVRAVPVVEAMTALVLADRIKHKQDEKTEEKSQENLAK